MKPTLVSVLFVLCAACGGSDSKGDTSNAKTIDSQDQADTQSSGEGMPCEQEIALVCEEGSIDACLQTPTTAATHACVEAEGADVEVNENGDESEAEETDEESDE